MTDSVDRERTSSEALERTRNLFRFLKAFAERSVPVHRQLGAHPWVLRLRDLPVQPGVELGEVLSSSPDADAPDEDSPPLLRVARPALTRAPTPPAAIAEWVQPGWERADAKALHLDVRNRVEAGETVTERFEADPNRVGVFESWRSRWDEWAKAERPALEAMRLFERLYELHGYIERESERLELVLGDGRLRWITPGGAVTDHPVLLQRVELHFDPGIPEFTVADAERAPELYGALVAEGTTISPAQLNELRSELERGGYHPLAREATSGYLRRLVQALGPHGRFDESLGAEAPGPHPVIARDAVLLLRTRPTGFPAAFDRVLLDLESREVLPHALTRLVGVEPPPPPEEIHAPSSPWGEPPDVLLSKPANAEQVHIARALERHHAVLVQGPPGTGKSHTIANLIGHLVARGKRVLVTSHTTKALRVLRDQVVRELQPLCVAVLETDAESRAQMEESVRGILSRITTANADHLNREIQEIDAQRAHSNAEIARITADLRTIREAEYEQIIVAGVGTPPAEAARWVIVNRAGNDWIPAPLEGAAPLPLADAELRDLYATNGQISRADEDELAAGIPSLEALPGVAQLSRMLDDARRTEPGEWAGFWERPGSEEELTCLDSLSDALAAMNQGVERLQPWERTVVGAGFQGGADRELWEELVRQVQEGVRIWDGSRSTLLEHDVDLPAELETAETRRIVEEIGVFVANGGSLGRWTLLTHGAWKTVLQSVRVNGGSPKTAAQFRAVSAHLALWDARRRLAARWGRQAAPAGLPAYSDLGAEPEALLTEYADHISTLLDWWGTRWKSLNSVMREAGFRWDEYRAYQVPRMPPATPFLRDVSLLAEPTREVVDARRGIALRARGARLLGELERLLGRAGSRVSARLRAALLAADSTAYAAALETLTTLHAKVPVWARRRELLTRLAAGAAPWAFAIHNREGSHGGASPPGDAANAWRWRQLEQEIERRAGLDEVELARRLQEAQAELRAQTARLIDRMAWREQLGRTDLRARQALQGWADTVRKIGKGTGKRAPALRAQARGLLERARDAVPVWIMPLSRVAESFDPATTRFDVVIVDEASQSDVTGVLAWYLADRIAVVGDHEQVSPLAVGQETEAVQALLRQHLHGIPNHHLYDGTTSIYDLARQSFGGTIALREHFRCVPDIIEFSNELSYNFEIQPLRDPSSVPGPHVAELVVTGSRSGKTNLEEARWIAALIKAMSGLDAYRGRTMGAITLLGDEQAGLIQDVAVRLIGAVELEGRRFVAGNSAQFQGDERHVVFLSMVDTPTGARLSLRQTQAFKQRYNVAVSRAQDQLWLVHSLDPGRDLNADDLRRRLIEHVRNPAAHRQRIAAAESRAESPFEVDVIRRLIGAGYRVTPQVWVGRYRLDMVVHDDHGRIALECDGDRFHGVDQIPADLARQAVLERAGWRFVRIRGTRYFRDPDRTMEWVFGELQRLGISPAGATAESQQVAPSDGLREEVLRRAWEVMRTQGWLPELDPENGPAETPLPGADAG